MEKLNKLFVECDHQKELENITPVKKYVKSSFHIFDNPEKFVKNVSYLPACTLHTEYRKADVLS